LVYAALVMLPLIVAALSRPLTDHGFVYELGRSFALVGLALLALQFVVSARLSWVERPYGLDALYRYHKAAALLAVMLIALHPVLLVLGGAGWGLLTRPDVSWHIWLGKLALLLLLIQVLGSIFRPRLRVGFEQWRFLHNQATVIFGLAFIHAWYTGGDFAEKAMQTSWWAMLAIAAMAYGYHKLIRPTILRRGAYRVAEVVRETHNVWTLHLEPPAGRSCFAYRPGQFQFLTLRRRERGLSVEEHPFTISSSPTQERLSSTIKESGDFTATIGRTRPGDLVSVQGPFGRFGYALHPGEADLVFIAGGIGITPFISMLRHMRDTQADFDVLLIYGNRTEADIVFRSELDGMTAGGHLRLRVVHVLSQADEAWHGERGYIDRGMLARSVGERVSGRAYYVCGPPPMMTQVVAALRSLGVPPGRIAFERFSL
jgi:predicted ferric reductase